MRLQPPSHMVWVQAAQLCEVLEQEVPDAPEVRPAATLTLARALTTTPTLTLL